MQTYLSLFVVLLLFIVMKKLFSHNTSAQVFADILLLPAIFISVERLLTTDLISNIRGLFALGMSEFLSSYNISIVLSVLFLFLLEIVMAIYKYSTRKSFYKIIKKEDLENLCGYLKNRINKLNKAIDWHDGEYIELDADIQIRYKEG